MRLNEVNLIILLPEPEAEEEAEEDSAVAVGFTLRATSTKPSSTVRSSV